MERYAPPLLYTRLWSFYRGLLGRVLYVSLSTSTMSNTPRESCLLNNPPTCKLGLRRTRTKCSRTLPRDGRCGPSADLISLVGSFHCTLLGIGGVGDRDQHQQDVFVHEEARVGEWQIGKS